MKLDIAGNSQVLFSAHGESTNEFFMPCPFCGSKNIKVTNIATPTYTAICEHCGCEGPPGACGGGHSKSRAACTRVHRVAFSRAVECWNTRVRCEAFTRRVRR